MPFETITPLNPPPPMAPYASATRAGDAVYVSGMLAIGANGQPIGIDDVRAQTHHVILLIEAAVQAAGGGLADIAFNHVFIKHLADYAPMNEVYRAYFGSKPPARYCIRADLVRPEFLVEIASIAHIPLEGRQ